MTPQQFKQRWERNKSDRLVAFPDRVLADVRLTSDARAFLMEAGLPEEAAPFLNFEPPNSGTLGRVSTVWHQPPTLACYRIIGHNGSGDPVCIDESADGQVVYLNHDNNFERVLMASSVLTLAECLAEFRDFIAEVGGVLDPIAPERFKPLIERLRSIDSAVSGADGYWHQECRCLQA
jgi:hypothetical protein